MTTTERLDRIGRALNLFGVAIHDSDPNVIDRAYVEKERRAALADLAELRKTAGEERAILTHAIGCMDRGCPICNHWAARQYAAEKGQNNAT